MAGLSYGDLLSDKELTPKDAQKYFTNINKMSDEEMKAVTKEILTQRPVLLVYGKAGIQPEEVGDFIAKMQESPNNMRNVIAAAYTSLAAGEMSNKADGIIDAREQNAVITNFAQRLSGHIRRFKEEQTAKKEAAQPQKQNIIQKAVKHTTTALKAMFGPSVVIGRGNVDAVRTSYGVKTNTQTNTANRTAGPRDL